jgi:hypothetical protein
MKVGNHLLLFRLTCNGVRWERMSNTGDSYFGLAWLSCYFTSNANNPKYPNPPDQMAQEIPISFQHPC